MKITVGSGDRGRTSLLSGERVSKTDARIEACGDVDELDSVLGALIASLPDHSGGLGAELAGIQGELLRIGARFAATPGSETAGMLEHTGPGRVKELEDAMLRMEKLLPPLQGFILPGGHPSAAWAHVARTVCRRAERRAVALAAESSSEDAARHFTGALTFLNRLSDYLWLLARREEGKPMVLKSPRSKVQSPKS